MAEKKDVIFRRVRGRIVPIRVNKKKQEKYKNVARAGLIGLTAVGTAVGFGLAMKAGRQARLYNKLKQKIAGLGTLDAKTGRILPLPKPKLLRTPTGRLTKKSSKALQDYYDQETTLGPLRRSMEVKKGKLVLKEYKDLKYGRLAHSVTAGIGTSAAADWAIKDQHYVSDQAVQTATGALAGLGSYRAGEHLYHAFTKPAPAKHLGNTAKEALKSVLKRKFKLK